MHERTVNLLPLNSLMEKFCLSTACSGDCEHSNCLAGFWFNVFAMPQKDLKKALKLQTIERFLPEFSEKAYAKEMALKCQTVVLLQCANCKHEHRPDCTLNLLRTTFHYFITQKWEQESYEYSGITQYLRHMIRESREDGLSLVKYCQQMKKGILLKKENF